MGQLDDRVAVADLLARSLSAVDRQDWTALLACFAPGARTVYRGAEGAIEDAIPNMARDLEATVASTHLLTTLVAEVDGTHARSIAYALVRGRRADPAVDAVLGVVYTNRFERLDGDGSSSGTRCPPGSSVRSSSATGEPRRSWRTSRMSLPTRNLGGTGIEITRVGIGSWALGGSDWTFGWGEQDDEDSIAAIRHAVDQGVNWIDTAPVYGLGHSEEVVARALDGVPERDRPHVFTKCGMVWDDSNRSEPPRLSATPETIRRDLEGSLRRLRTERIDLYQMHWPSDDGTAVEDYWSALLDLKAQGKVRAVGLSNHGIDRLEQAEDVGHVDCLQPPFSAINRRSAAEITWCLDHGTGVIVYSPLQSGLLTGSFSAARAACLAPDDWRSKDEEFRGERLTRNLALADALRPIADDRQVPVAAVAVAWTLAWPGVSGAIVGVRRPDQVESWIPAATLELTHRELDRIAAAIDATGAGEGPSRPRRLVC